ncbi:MULTISPECIES: hypothetical protein [Streptomyces]|uniref:Uncharacterized protein n=3 Tax=Streptomyces TaxID=1883 RepID=A0A3S9PJS2_STRLT|nr:hypothetical protein [Streptomyces luteoverticillatus]AZQ72598.1 hypothetical protein EKH77_16460 [Streptomyces luteoverticillatus]
MAGGDFYTHDRPDNPRLPEDRPRGGGPGSTALAHHPMRIGVVIVIAVLVVLAFGIMLFP